MGDWKSDWSRRRRAIEEWRGLPEPRGKDRAVKAADVLTKILEEIGAQESYNEEEVARAWFDLMGENIARNSHPTKLVNSVLTVRVLQPTLLYTLEREQKRAILRRLQEKFGRKAITDVRFTVG